MFCEVLWVFGFCGDSVLSFCRGVGLGAKRVDVAPARWLWLSICTEAEENRSPSGVSCVMEPMRIAVAGG